MTITMDELDKRAASAFDGYLVRKDNVKAYSPFRYSLIQTLGFSTLVCFIGGYFVWAFNLS